MNVLTVKLPDELHATLTSEARRAQRDPGRHLCAKSSRTRWSVPRIPRHRAVPGSRVISSAPSTADAPIWRRIGVCSTRPSSRTRSVASPTVVVDTGPIVALLDADEAHHGWARGQFDTLAPPLLTCEAVLSETSFLLQRVGADPSLPVTLVERGVLRIARAPGFQRRRARDRPADPSLPKRSDVVRRCVSVRLVERMDHASVMTLDSDFHIYRQARRRVIPLLAPP